MRCNKCRATVRQFGGVYIEIMGCVAARVPDGRVLISNLTVAIPLLVFLRAL